LVKEVFTALPQHSGSRLLLAITPKDVTREKFLVSFFQMSFRQLKYFTFLRHDGNKIFLSRIPMYPTLHRHSMQFQKKQLGDLDISNCI